MAYFNNYDARKMLKEAKENVETMIEEARRPKYPNGITLDELISKLTEIRQEIDGDTIVQFEAEEVGGSYEVFDICYEKLTSEDFWDWEDYVNYKDCLPQSVTIKIL